MGGVMACCTGSDNSENDKHKVIKKDVVIKDGRVVGVTTRESFQSPPKDEVIESTVEIKTSAQQSSVPRPVSRSQIKVDLKKEEPFKDESVRRSGGITLVREDDSGKTITFDTPTKRETSSPPKVELRRQEEKSPQKADLEFALPKRSSGSSDRGDTSNKHSRISIVRDSTPEESGTSNQMTGSKRTTFVRESGLSDSLVDDSSPRRVSLVRDEGSNESESKTIRPRVQIHRE